MKLYIVRHGQTDKNKARVLQGRSNTLLNDVGKQQASDLGEKLKDLGIHIDKIYSSPLIRAVETAKLICGSNIEPILDDRLLEMDYGPYEGTDLTNPPEEIRTFFKDFVHNPAPEGMEKLSDVVQRLGSFAEEIASEDDCSVLVATHAIAMKGALEYLSPDAKGMYWSKHIGNCEIYWTEYKNGTYTVPQNLF